MENLVINYVKLNDDAHEPIKKYEFDAGFDLIGTWKKETDKYIEYGTGLAFQIPPGYVGLLFPRSSVTKEDLMLKNSVGVIDSGYLGEIKLRFAKQYNDIYGEYVSIGKENAENYINTKILGRISNQYVVGDRIGQIIIIKIPLVKFNLVDKLIETDRGTDGYGSTGK